ncbi:MAG: EamA family transporter [Candidatus Omnitrophica bacterium]|nr:EamA family transporter [Candidatus Omnitrophota bacterium]
MKLGLFFVLFLIGLTSLLDTINQLFLKSAINSLQVNLSANIFKILKFVWQVVLIPKVWLGGICTLISLCIWLFVLSKADLNFAFSADSMHYIFIAFASRLFLKEKVGFKRWLGTIFIVLGIVFISIS